MHAAYSPCSLFEHKEQHQKALTEPHSGLLGELCHFKVLDHRVDFTITNAL